MFMILMYVSTLTGYGEELGLVGERSNAWSVTTSLGLEFHNCRSSAFSLAIFALFIADLPQKKTAAPSPTAAARRRNLLLTAAKSLMPYVGKQMMMPSCLSNAFSCDGGSVAGALALTAAHAASFLMLLSLSRLRSEGKAGFAQNSGSSTSLFLSGSRSKGEKGKVPHLRTSVRTAAPCWWEEKHLF